MKKATVPLLVMLGLASVGALYGVLRVKQVLVHVRTTSRDAHGHFVVADHSVRAEADAPAVLVVFAPFRWVETALWLVVEPRGSTLGLP